MLINRLRQDDQTYFQNFVRVPIELFDGILQRITTGESMKASFLGGRSYYSNLLYDFSASISMISKLVPELCHDIVGEYKDEVI